ncbi:MAG: YidC/Oxa1 family membrane protein insertase [Saccharofermentanales bacterium]|jgi:YidC/Oxa1 family membrane protein insertase
MNFIPVQLGLLDPLYKLFGWILGVLYSWIGSYGLVIILFTVGIRLLLMPLALKSQRSSLRQQLLVDEVNEIKRHYGNDQQRVNEMTQQLYKENGISMTSGCLPMVLQLLLIWPVFYLFRSPLRWITNVSVQNLRNIAGLMQTHGLMTQAEVNNVALMDIPVLAGLRDSGTVLEQSVSNGWITLDKLINTNFLGMDLARTPSWNPLDWFGENWRVELPLVILILITMITYFIQMKIMRNSRPRPEKTKEEKRRDKANPAKRGQEADTGSGMLKSMNYIMPIFMLFTMFRMPAAMCVFWFAQNIVYLMQSMIGYQYYIRPLRLSYERDQAQYDRSRPAEIADGNRPSKNRKSKDKKKREKRSLMSVIRGDGPRE